MNDTTHHSFTRREFAALLFGLTLASGGSPFLQQLILLRAMSAKLPMT